MGSVAEMMEPKRSAMSTGSPINQCTRYPVKQAQRPAHQRWRAIIKERSSEWSARTSSFTLPSKTSAGRNRIKSHRASTNRVGDRPGVATTSGMNDSKEQSTEDKGHRVGNLQTFSQYGDDCGSNEQPNQNSMPELGVISELYRLRLVEFVSGNSTHLRS